MSTLLLSQLISTYINSYEGHTQSEGDNLIEVRDRLTNATIDEINTEFNSLTQQNIWVPPLMTIFYDELLERIMNETTFAISTAWSSVAEWVKNPFVVIRAGFEEVYPVIDTDGSFIRADDPTVYSFTLMDDSFSKPIKQMIIRLLLRDGVVALVQLGVNGSGGYTGQLQIVGIENGRDLGDQIMFIGEQMSGIQDSYQSVRVKAKVQDTPDWNMLRKMYESLRAEKPVIVDPFQDRLINQLIDADELEDIIDENGLTFEGDLAIEVTGEIDIYEEPIEPR